MLLGRIQTLPIPLKFTPSIPGNRRGKGVACKNNRKRTSEIIASGDVQTDSDILTAVHMHSKHP